MVYLYLGIIHLTTAVADGNWKLFSYMQIFVQLTAAVQIMIWDQSGVMPYSQPMPNLLKHICITGPHWVKQLFDFHEKALRVEDDGNDDTKLEYL